MAVSPSNAQLHAMSRLKSHSNLLRYINHFHKQKISYNNVSKPRPRSTITCMSSSSRSGTNISNVLYRADKDIIPRPVNKSASRSPWAEDVFDSKHHDHKLREEYTEAVVELLKERVRRKLTDDEELHTPRDKLVFIDTLERLGIAYDFEREIEYQIEKISKYYFEPNNEVVDLFTTALCFRMCRQHGHNVSCSVFDKFRDQENKFKEGLSGNDVEGLLSLYEASFLRSHEEVELKEAREFATHHLKKANLRLKNSSYLKQKVNRALSQPLHWALPKVEARYYISIYEKKESKDDMLLRLAKLDFHVMQNMYKREMHELQKWWYGFDLMSRLPYARDCIVPSYFWASALSHEPKYSRSRIAATKVFVIGTLLNDTYDNYATLEELEALTDAMQRLDDTDVENLAEYMKIIYDALLHAFDEFVEEASEERRSYGLAYCKETFRQVASAFHKKAEWYNLGNNKDRPTFQDYVGSMGITSGLQLMLAAFYMHDESSSKGTFDWLASKPSAVERAALYCRYLNDICSYERERESGQYPTSLDCYMEENGVSLQETKEKFAEFAEECWMALNKEMVEATFVPDKDYCALKPAINFCRVMFALYGYGLDLFSRPEDGLVTSIDALLLDPILM